MKKSFLLAALLFAVWMAAAFLSYSVAFLSISVTEVFATGRTFFKEYFFFMWGTLLFFALAFLSAPSRKREAYGLTGLLLLVSVLNVAAHVVYTRRTGFGLADYTMTVTGAKLTSNSLLHTHVFKTFLSYVLWLVGVDPLSLSGDAGFPLVPLIPPLLVWLGLILTLLAIALTVRVIVGRKSVWSGRQFWPFWIAILVASYALLKCLCDGGPLSGEFLVYLPPFLYLVFNPPASAWSLIQKCVRWWLAGFALTALVMFGLRAGFFWVTLFDFILLTVSFSTLVLIVEWVSAGRSAPGLRHLLWLVPVTVAMSFNHYFGQQLRYLRQKIEPGDRVYVLGLGDQVVPLHKFLNEGPMSVYAETATVPSSVWEIHERYRIPPSYPSVAIVWKTCDPEVPFSRAGRLRVLRTSRPVSQEVSKMFAKFQMRPCSREERCDYRFDAVVKGCIPDALYFSVISQFEQMGFASFTIKADEL